MHLVSASLASNCDWREVGGEEGSWEGSRGVGQVVLATILHDQPAQAHDAAGMCLFPHG